MAFWTTAKQSKPKFQLLSKELKRFCNLYQDTSYVVHRRISSRTLIPELNYPDFIIRNSQMEIFCSVRFFAAPAQANQKKEEVTSGPRLNEQITSQFIRLVSGEDHKVISRFDALGLAKNLKLDLVEVDRFAKPPVCKILDFNKEKYLRQMKDKERAKSKPELKSGAFKEVRFAAKIKQKDLQMKADMAKRLMENGHRVKCTAIEPTEDVDLETLLYRFSALIKDVAVEESEQKVEKKQAFVVVRHIKFGPSKKSSGKKAAKASESTRNSSSKDSGSPLTARSPLEENGDIVGACLETEVPDSEELLDKDAQTNKSKWAVFHGAEDFDKVFDIKNESHDLPRNEQSGIATSSSSSGTSSRPTLESARAHATSSKSMEVPKQGMVNRYSRDPRLGKSLSDRDTRSSTNNIPPIPAQGKQPQFSVNASPKMRQPQRLEVPSQETSKQPSSHTGVRHSPFYSYDTAAQNPMNRAFKVPHRGKQPQVDMDASPQLRTPVQAEVPTNEFSRQDSSHSSIPNSSTKSFGIFSSQQVDTMPENAPTESNRYSKRNPSYSARSRSTTVVSTYKSPPAPEGRWGRFSMDSSSTLIPNKDESQAETQRR